MIDSPLTSGTPNGSPSEMSVAATNASSAQASHPAQRFQFTGSGGEYFRIWIVNVLLTIVTLGIYSAWAKVRRLRYFYNNTRLAGSSFDFRGSPIAILKGRVIAFLLLLLIQVPFLGAVVLIFYFALLPWFIYRSMRFHLANTTYRNLRFAFMGTAGGIYRAILFPIAIILISVVMSFIVHFASRGIGSVMLAISIFAFYGIGPYIQYRIRAYVTAGSRMGTAQFGLHVGPGRYYLAYVVAVGYWIAYVAVAFAILATVFGLDLSSLQGTMDAIKEGSIPHRVAMIILLAVFYIGMLAVVPLVQGMLQNTVWSGTSLERKAFQSDLRVANYVVTWLGVTILTVITIGLYRPFAVVQLARLRLEALSWQGSPDDLIAVQRAGSDAAAGAEITDMMDVDFGF
ncbi:MAG: DUF898 domain-containing protein [Proteobacteria bacterium]|nr:DUF898 domain-containing protein [Pseudomonadota bacterium]